MPGPIQSIQRAAAVLDLLERSPRALVLREIVDELCLPKATVHGILRTLVELEYVDHDAAGAAYMLGARRHGAPANLDPNVLRSAGMGWCDTLAARVGAQVWLVVATESTAVLAHHVFRPDDAPQRLRVGEELPLHATAAGKLLLAYSSNRERLLRNMILERFTTATITSRATLSAQITAVRGAGLAADVGEFEPNLAAVAVPVHGSRPGAMGALAVCGTPGMLLRDGTTPRGALVDQLRTTASAIARELGSAR